MELKDSLLMPKTSFEMRGNLTQKEPLFLKKWDDLQLYTKMNENREGCEEFLLHDGPPYANGNIHCGHMLNRLLKDFVVRYKNMEGYKTPFIFGWDTHGLPIEVQLTKSGVNRKSMALLFAGAVGNLIDRTFYWSGTTGFDGVIDFMCFYLQGPTNNPFAIFNVADASLSIGIVMLIIVLLVRDIKKEKGQTAQEQKKEQLDNGSKDTDHK